MLIDEIASLLLNLTYGKWDQETHFFSHYEQFFQDKLIDELNFITIAVESTGDVRIIEIFGLALVKGWVKCLGLRVLVANWERSLDTLLVINYSLNPFTIFNILFLKVI